MEIKLDCCRYAYFTNSGTSWSLSPSLADALKFFESAVAEIAI